MEIFVDDDFLIVGGGEMEFLANGGGGGYSDGKGFVLGIGLVFGGITPVPLIVDFAV